MSVVLIFSMFGVPLRYQHRVLMCGVIGALVMRAAFIASGAALLDTFHLTIYLFGALLIYTAVRVLRHGGTQIHPDQNPVLRLMRRVIPTTDTLHGAQVLHPGRRQVAGHPPARRAAQTGLAIILAGVGVKLLLTDVYPIPTWASLLFILSVLAGTFGLSWRATRGSRGREQAGQDPGHSLIEQGLTLDQVAARGRVR